MKRRIVLNPYENADWEKCGRYKAALHLHTLQSDGYNSVNQVVRAHKRAGYTIVSLTDHDWNRPNARITWGELPPDKASPYPEKPLPDNYPANPTWPWTDYRAQSPEDLGIVGIQGNELTFRHHINSYFSRYGIWYEKRGSGAPYEGIVDESGKEINEDDQLLSIRDEGGLAILNHPGIPDEKNWWSRKPLEWYMERFAQHPPDYLIGMEITNNESPWNLFDECLWDQLLSHFMPERPVWGFGNNDMHSLANHRLAYNVFILEHLNEREVRRAMLEGRFYFTTSTMSVNCLDDSADIDVFPVIDRVHADGNAGTVAIEASNYDEIRWISAVKSREPLDDYRTGVKPWAAGKIVSTGEILDYKNNPGIEDYVRAELLRYRDDEVHRTLTNPFAFEIR